MADNPTPDSNETSRGASSERGALASGWEREALERIALAAINEQRAARRWRIFFRFAFLAVLVVIVVRAVPSGPDERAARTRFDVAGAVLLGLGLAALLTGVSEGPNWGWSAAPTIGLFVAAAVLLAVWVVVELRVAHPLINLRVLRNGEVLLANATAIGLGTVMYMGLSIGSLIAQAPAGTGYGIALPVLWAGFVMFPLSVGSFLANRLTHRLARRIQLPTLLPMGAAVVTASSILLLFAHRELWEILLGMFLFGVGIGATYAAMPGLIARRVVAQELGSAVGFNQVLRTVGGSFGSAISGAILAANMAPDQHPSGVGITLALVISAAACSVVLIALVVNHVVTGLAHRSGAVSGTGGSAAFDGQEDNSFDTHTPNHIHVRRLNSFFVAASPLQHD